MVKTSFVNSLPNPHSLGAETVQPFGKNLKNVIYQLSTNPTISALSRGMVTLTAQTVQLFGRNGKNIVCQLSTRPILFRRRVTKTVLQTQSNRFFSLVVI